MNFILVFHGTQNKMSRVHDVLKVTHENTVDQFLVLFLRREIKVY